jgi:uncharacterized protein (DUF2235 family)
VSGKRIVLCLDGTWNSAYTARKRSERGDTVLKPTNVLKMCRAVLPRDPATGREQIAYYDSGVGSLAEYPGVSNQLLHLADRVLGGAWGAGFEGNVEEALGFLANNHEAGDQTFLFGFSRGAAAAQAVTRFLDWCGGLPAKRDAYYLPILFRAYVVSKGQRPCAAALAEIDAKRAREGRAPLRPTRPVAVELLAVWDTVMALGSRFRAKGARTSTASRSFHVGEQPAACVKHARQSLAIDEARYDFRPEIWKSHAAQQTLEQRWFAGVHSNVGGGYVDDGLANVAFRWLAGEAAALGLGLDPDYIGHFRSYPQDRLYRSESLLYRFLDGLRLRFGRGRRRLAGPPAANLLLDRSVIHRLQADPAERVRTGAIRFPELQGKPYRPRNLLRFLASLPDLDAYLRRIGLAEEASRQLPPDVGRQLATLRADG